MTWDSLPIVGRIPGLENGLLAAGHNMLGMALAAGTGRLIGELVDDSAGGHAFTHEWETFRTGGTSISSLHYS